jgi:flagellar protein FlbT
MIISLKAGARLFLNGAVVKADRRVNLELLNDAVFILDAHVLQPHEATTPLRQLYFAVQTLLVDPGGAAETHALIRVMLGNLLRTFEKPEVLAGLKLVGEQLAAGRAFDAIKTVRALFAAERAILDADAASSIRAA